ncbi:MAG: tocopherol O-methyltransferase [bacterium]
MITNEQIPEFYDWLSRYVQVSNWLAYRDRFAGFTMHKRLDVPGTAGSRAAGLRYVNEHVLEVARGAGLPADPRVLDAGCGFGGTTFHWQRATGGRYDGLTLSKVQVRVAERQARRRGIEHACTFTRRSYDAPIERDYDAVVAIEALIHSADLHRTVANLAGAIRPGGLLLVLDDMATADLDAVRPAEAGLLRSHWGCARYHTGERFRAAIAQSGLALLVDEDLSPLMRPRPRADLDRLERIYARAHRLVGVRPVRTVVSAFLGGIALERLHASGDVEYRLLVARSST